MQVQRKIEKYVIGNTIGSGQFAKVKIGFDENGKKVALKMLIMNRNGGALAAKKQMGQVNIELECLKAIRHRNVINLLEIYYNAKYTQKNGKVLDVILMVLELGEGGELFNMIAYTGAFHDTIARTYLAQLISAVDHCHSKGIAHRDLKPENLLLDADGNLKVADFGLSHRFSALNNRMFTECGTPGYMAPEIFNNQGYDGQAADAWAIGVIVFIMLAGFPPFAQPNRDDWWFDKLLKGKHNLFWAAHCRTATFTKEAKDFIQKVLNPDPKQRLTLAQMREHIYMKLPTMTPTDLKSEISRRIFAVNAKDELRREKERRNNHTANAQKHASGMVTRGIGDVTTGDDLPATTPCMSHFNLVMKNEDDIEYSNKRNVKAVLETYDASIANYSKFTTKAPEHVALQRVTQALNEIEANFVVREEKYMVKKVVVKSSAGQVELNIQIFGDANDKNLRHVVFTRRQGRTMLFRSAYMDIFSQLTDLF